MADRDELIAALESLRDLASHNNDGVSFRIADKALRAPIQPVAAPIVPSDEQIIEAADVTCSAWFAATEEYMFKRDNLNRFAQLITTASNAGEAMLGEDK